MATFGREGRLLVERGEQTGSPCVHEFAISVRLTAESASVARSLWSAASRSQTFAVTQIRTFQQLEVHSRGNEEPQKCPHELGSCQADNDAS